MAVGSGDRAHGLTNRLYERELRDDVARGDLVVVLDAFATSFPGLYLYHPGTRQASPPLRALVDYVRRTREGARHST